MFKKDIPKINNFDLIRLFAALQVVFTHSVHHFEIGGLLAKFGDLFVYYFPGVPIFFTISGFLIFWSFDRNSDDLKKYFRNRFLRLFPALWFCLIITIILLLIDIPDIYILLKAKQFWIWIIAQLSIFQFWTPDILRSWGVGTPNGSLWTIAIEVQFYIFVPILYFILKKFKKNTFLIVLLFIIFSSIVNLYFGKYPEESMIYKIASISVLPYLYNFLFGVLLYIFWDKIKNLVQGKFFIWFGIYVTYIIIFGNWLGNDLNSYFLYTPYHFISNIFLAFLVLSAAFTFNGISNKLLNHNDISYGVYIYHMLIINFLVQRNLIGEIKYLIVTFIVTIVLSTISWMFIEKKFLKLKKTK